RARRRAARRGRTGGPNPFRGPEGARRARRPCRPTIQSGPENPRLGGRSRVDPWGARLARGDVREAGKMRIPFIVKDPCSRCLLKRDVALQKEVDEIIADVWRLALLAVALQNFHYGLRKPVPGASVLDEVVEALVQRLPAGFLHALLEPASRFQGEAGANAGEFHRSWRPCHSLRIGCLQGVCQT